MSKHLNFICNDTLYSNIIEFMKVNNIKNISWALRILIRKGLQFEEELDNVINDIEYIPNFSSYIDCISEEDIL